MFQVVCNERMVVQISYCPGEGRRCRGYTAKNEGGGELSFQTFDIYNFKAKEKLPSGQTAEIIFETYENSNGDLTFWIMLDVYHKRKQKSENILKQTGKDGLKSLLWAKNKIKEFEEDILSSDLHWVEGKALSIAIGWEDNRRRTAYERGLRSLGYSFGHWDGGKVLIKKIR